MDTTTGDDGHSVVAEAEKFLAAVQGQTLPVVDLRVLELQTIIAAEQECLDKILPALIEISQIIERVRMPKKKRERLLRQLAHASEHLYNNFEDMQNNGY